MNVATTDLANAFLDRAFRERRAPTARALNDMCCLASFAYTHLTGRRLLAEEIMATDDGPRLYSLGDKFRGHEDDPVTAYLRTASFEVSMVGDDDADLSYVVRRCWNSTRDMPGEGLNAILTDQESLWRRARNAGSPVIDHDEAVYNCHYYVPLGWHVPVGEQWGLENSWSQKSRSSLPTSRFLNGR